MVFKGGRWLAIYDSVLHNSYVFPNTIPSVNHVQSYTLGWQSNTVICALRRYCPFWYHVSTGGGIAHSATMCRQIWSTYSRWLWCVTWHVLPISRPWVDRYHVHGHAGYNVRLVFTTSLHLHFKKTKQLGVITIYQHHCQPFLNHCMHLYKTKKNSMKFHGSTVCINQVW